MGEVAHAYLRLLNSLSAKPLPRSIASAPQGAEALLSLVYRGEPPEVHDWMPVRGGGAKADKARACVVFSGGKDSVSVALRLVAQGKRVVLVHVAGANRYAAAEEEKAARALAPLLGLPLEIVRLDHEGKAEWVENPIRNNFLLACAADLMARQGVRLFALGTMRSHAFDAEVVETGVSDAVEVVDATAVHLAQVWKGLRVDHLLASNSDSFREVAKRPDLLPEIRSCLIGARFREAHRRTAKRVHGVDLLPGRCGVCSKCAGEYLHLAPLGALPWSASFAARCMTTLRRAWAKHYGRKGTEAEALAYFLDAQALDDLSKVLPLRASSHPPPPKAHPNPVQTLAQRRQNRGLWRGGVQGKDPTFYAQKREVEARLGRTLSTPDFRENHWVPSESYRGTSIFDPVLCELAYRWWSPPGGLVLDPFAGGSVRGIVAALLGRRYLGVELSQAQKAANEAQRRDVFALLGRVRASGTAFPGLGEGGPPMPRWTLGDARALDKVCKEPVDFLFTCPPYGSLERYSDDPRDLSAMQDEEFDAAYREVIVKACRLLRPDSFACYVVGDYRDARGVYRNLVGRTVAAFEEGGLAFYNEAILITPAGSLPIRVARMFEGSRKLGKAHQNVLVFVKGDPEAATKRVGACEFGEIVLDQEADGGGAPQDQAG
jgi:DNA modification methylase